VTKANHRVNKKKAGKHTEAPKVNTLIKFMGGGGQLSQSNVGVKEAPRK
jgi:hypothetical protein